MGQQPSSFVVEIASPRYGKFQSLPQKDPDEDDAQWRITVNPAAELAANDQLRTLISRLNHVQKHLAPSDARQILAALHYLDISQDLMLPLLTVISNTTAFASNQVLLRDFGVTKRVVELFNERHYDWPKSCRIMLLQCIANMAVDVENEVYLKKSIPNIIRRMESSIEMESTIAIQALTNLTINISTAQIYIFLPSIPHCLNKLWLKGEVNLHALRLLVNLACCPDMVPHILASKTITGVLTILDTDKQDVLLRAVTWLLSVEALSITYDHIAPLNQDPFGNPTYTLYHTLYGMKGKVEMEQKAAQLSEIKNIEIANKSKRLYEILRQITPMRSSCASLNRL